MTKRQPYIFEEEHICEIVMKYACHAMHCMASQISAGHLKMFDKYLGHVKLVLKYSRHPKYLGHLKMFEKYHVLEV